MTDTQTIARACEEAANRCTLCRRGWPFKLTKAGESVHVNENTGQIGQCEGALYRTAARALREREWRPIESAPKDGTRVLVSALYREIPGYWNSIGHYAPIGCEWRDDTDRAFPPGDPTHWQPLPSPPKEGE